MAINKFEDSTYRSICSEKTLQSNSKGFFLTFADFVAKEVGDNWIKNVFGKLKCDKERISLVYKANEVKDYVVNFLNNVQEVYRPKNAEFSQKKRLEAENLSQKNEDNKALVLFSQSVLRAPKTGENKKIDSGLSLALALWGRSQVLIKLNKFKYALCDVQQALKENLPGSFKAQAYWRMGICYKALGEENKANVSFNLAEKLLENEIDQLNLLKQDRNRNDGVSESITKKPIERPIILSPSKNLTNANNKLCVKISQDTGRYIVANEKIPVGEVLVVEPSYAACLLPELFGIYCHNCFQRLESPIGCPDCSSVAFCGLDCRNKAVFTYHKYECKYLDLLIGSGMSILAHTALRMITQFGLKKCLDIYNNKEKEKIYQLCSNAHLRSPNDFFQRTLMATFLLRCLQKSNFFEDGLSGAQVVPTHQESKIGEMLLFYLQILQFNAHEIYETRNSDNLSVKDAKIVYIGVGVYLTASLFNHDCFPALTRHFVGKNIVLTAARPLEPNDMVPENYGPVFTRKTLPERQKSLSSRYWFACKCVACLQNWPQIDRGLEDVSQRLRCPTKKCLNFFTLPSKELVKCPKCKQDVNLSGRILLLKWCEEQYHLAFEHMNRKEIDEAKKILCIAIETFYRISLPPHKETHLAEEMFRICLADQGNSYQTTS